METNRDTYRHRTVRNPNNNLVHFGKCIGRCLGKSRYVSVNIVTAFLTDHIQFPISLPLELCLYLQPFPRCYHLFVYYECM